MNFWTCLDTLYGIMGCASYRIRAQEVNRKHVALPLGDYDLQLALNFTWTPDCRDRCDALEKQKYFPCLPSLNSQNTRRMAKCAFPLVVSLLMVRPSKFSSRCLIWISVGIEYLTTAHLKLVRDYLLQNSKRYFFRCRLLNVFL